MFTTFSYLSRLSGEISDDALVQLGQASVAFNRQHEITGLLLFDGHFFAQVIEGPQAGIARVRGRILHDRRHELVEVGPEIITAKREFSDWAMRVVDTRPQSVALGVERQLGAGASLRVHPELLAFFRSAAGAARA